MSNKISKELAKHRLEQVKTDLEESQILYNSKLYKGANNRAYYAIFHSIKAILSLEPIDFKRHKDVLAYFNKNYVKTEKFPKGLGHRISEASKIRDDSDYDDEFVADKQKTLEQINVAKEMIELVEKYVENYN